MKVYVSLSGGIGSITYRLKEADREYAKRGSVNVFSDGSRRRMSKYLRSCSSAYGVIGTLTYPSEFNAHAFREHWRAFASRWRRLFIDDDGASMFWFLEFQANGQPHFHFYTNRYIEKGWLSTAWASICRTGNVNHYKSGTNISGFRGGRKGILGYAIKYAAKTSQKTMPDMYKDTGSGRWWGVVGCRSVVSASIAFDDCEIGFFGIDSLLDLIRNAHGKVLFDDFGSFVLSFDDDSCFWRVFKEVRRANTLLSEAEANYQKNFYRERRG